MFEVRADMPRDLIGRGSVRKIAEYLAERRRLRAFLSQSSLLEEGFDVSSAGF
jgi:hypothetical protein